MAKAGETQDRCTQYALDVVSGKITAGEYVRLACQRHLDDIEKSKAAPYKYYFDVEKSEEIINFAEELTIAEGEENEHVTAYPFQCFILGSLNGWRTKEKSYRRFRTSYVQLGRQNGKSFINGILACYYGNFDGYKYGKIFCTATKQDQANIVFDEVAKFINSDEDLSEWFKVHDHNHTIDCLLTHSEIKALSGDTKSLDGHRAYLGIVDEYHAHKTNQMYKLLEGGIKKLKSALISVITTAGFDLKSPCYKLYEYCCNLLKGVFENDSQFVYIAQMDEHDDRYVPENWIKANPILEFDRDALENLIPIAHTARDMGGEDLRDFLVKQLNMWMQWSNSLYIKDIAKWKACAVLKSLKDFRGSKCYVGVDLSSGGDLTSIAIVIPFMIDGVKKYFVHTHSFIPSSRVDEHIKTDKVPYDVWIEKGLVTVTETLGGIKTDYKYIIKYLEDLVKEYDLKPQLICYDPHNASAFLSDLEALGFDSISVTQTAKDEKLTEYSTTEEMNAAIKVKADAIESTVSKKVGSNEIISKINQSAEKVSINASKISLNGAVTANSNFKINTDGSAETKALKITGGSLLIGGNCEITNAGNVFALSPKFYSGLYINSDFKTGTLSKLNYSMLLGYVGRHIFVGEDGGTLWGYGFTANNNIYAYGTIGCLGKKSRIIHTDDGRNIEMYAYETASPTFGDMGTGKLDEDGQCYVYLDDDFLLTVEKDMKYHVMLTAKGAGELYVESTNEKDGYFVVKGMPKLEFYWEVKTRQKGCRDTRIEQSDIPEKEDITAEEQETLNEQMRNQMMLLYEMEKDEIEVQEEQSRIIEKMEETE